MDRALRFVIEKDDQHERPCSLMRICLVLALLVGISLLLAPSWSTAQSNLDHVQQSVQMMDASGLATAEKEARLALRDSSTRPAALATLGAIRVRQKKYQEATELLRTALRLDPGLVDAQITLGDVYILTGKKEQAREALREALRTDPGNREVLFCLSAGRNLERQL